MDERDIWIEILKLCQGKYNCADELYRLTKEMGDVLSRDDRVAVQMLLGMRQDEMDKFTQIDTSILVLKNTYPWLEGRLKAITSTSSANTEYDTIEEKKIAEVCQQTKAIIDRTIEIDRVINRKIAGKDSFY